MPSVVLTAAQVAEAARKKKASGVKDAAIAKTYADEQAFKKNMTQIVNARSGRIRDTGASAPAAIAAAPERFSQAGKFKTFDEMKAKGLISGDMSKETFNAATSGADASPGVGYSTSRKFDSSKVINNLATYGTNIANAFRRPPEPRVPENFSPVTLQKMNFDNARNEATRASRTADLAANRSLDSQSAAAVRSGNFATRLGAMNQLNTQEANANSATFNQQAQINAGIDNQNVNQRNQYQDRLTEMNVANQREKSQNLANASDKFVAIQNEQSKAQLEMDKYKVGMDLFKESGVFNRYLKEQTGLGNTDPTGINKQFQTKKAFGGKLKSLSAGGIMRKLGY